MDISLWSVLIGIVAGALGYCLTTFFVQPILRYRDVRNKILMDFIYYAQVIDPKGLNARMKNLYEERVLANRRASAQLYAAIQDLPWCYLIYLKYKGGKPQEVPMDLIGYANNTNYGRGYDLEQEIRKKLCLPED